MTSALVSSKPCKPLPSSICAFLLTQEPLSSSSSAVLQHLPASQCHTTRISAVPRACYTNVHVNPSHMQASPIAALLVIHAFTSTPEPIQLGQQDSVSAAPRYVEDLASMRSLAPQEPAQETSLAMGMPSRGANATDQVSLETPSRCVTLNVWNATPWQQVRRNQPQWHSETQGSQKDKRVMPEHAPHLRESNFAKLPKEYYVTSSWCRKSKPAWPQHPEASLPCYSVPVPCPSSP